MEAVRQTIPRENTETGCHLHNTQCWKHNRERQSTEILRILTQKENITKEDAGIYTVEVTAKKKKVLLAVQHCKCGGKRRNDYPDTNGNSDPSAFRDRV